MGAISNDKFHCWNISTRAGAGAVSGISLLFVKNGSCLIAFRRTDLINASERVRNIFILISTFYSVINLQLVVWTKQLHSCVSISFIYFSCWNYQDEFDVPAGNIQSFWYSPKKAWFGGMFLIQGWVYKCLVPLQKAQTSPFRSWVEFGG